MECCTAGIKRALSFSSQPRQRSRQKTVKMLKEVNTEWVPLNIGGEKVSKGYNIDANQLGEGGFGSVSKVTDKTTGAELVMKAMVKADIPNPACFRNEIQFQAKCDHPHIARLHEVFEDREKVYIVMEACEGGEILDMVVEQGKVGELDAWHIFHQLVKALVYLHTKVFLAHRDLKPENFLIKESGLPLHESTMKLIDFGFAQSFEPGEQSLKTKCGTPYYMCPEILKHPYNEKCDIWASGVILYLLLSGELPFYGEETPEILEKINAGKLTFQEPAWMVVDESAQALISQMCSLDPADRPSAEEVAKHAWMQRTREQVEQTCAPTPKKSVGEVARNLKRYQKMSKFKKVALGAIGHVLEDKDIKLLKDTFAALDVEGDGVIEVETLKEALTDAGIAVKDIDEMCKGLAVDGDISYSAFLAANVRRESYLKESYCHKAFRVFDKDGSGSINFAEFQQMMTREMSDRFSDEQAAEMFQRMDTSGDGEVDFDEFMSVLKAEADGTASPGDSRGGSFAPSFTPPEAPQRLISGQSQRSISGQSDT